MPVITAGGGGAATSSLTLPHAQILTLPTVTSNVIVPAPGAGRMVVPLMAVFSSHCAAGAYTNADVWAQTAVYNGSVFLAWDAPTNFNDATGPVQAAHLIGTTTPKVAISGPTTGVILAGMLDNNVTSDVKDVGVPDTTANGYVNAGLYVVAQNAGGNFTGGNAANTLVVTVAYVVVPV